MNNKKLISLLIFLVGISDIVYGIYYHNKKIEDMNARVKILANIHQVTTTSKDQTLYLDFYLKNKNYSSVVVIDRKQKIGHSINVYCLKTNPTQCILENKNYNGYYMIGLGIFILLINVIGFFKKI